MIENYRVRKNIQAFIVQRWFSLNSTTKLSSYSRNNNSLFTHKHPIKTTHHRPIRHFLAPPMFRKG